MIHPTPIASGRWPGFMMSLRHRTFRLYFLGQLVSIMGTWIQQVAMSWLVYRLTGSAELLGITAFLIMAPQMVVAPLMGAVFDRFDRRRLLIAVEGLLVLHGASLGALTLSGLITPDMIIGMALLLGVLNGIDTPLRQSLIGSLLDDPRSIRNAFALNAMAFNAGRFLGPPVAGVILSLTSEGVCFSLNALSYLALIVALVFIGPRPMSQETVPQKYLEALREGFTHAWRNPPPRVLLLLVAAVNLTASSYVVLLPIFAKEVFLGDARALGWLMGAAGAGAVLATVVLAMLQRPNRMPPVMAAGALGCAMAMLVFSRTADLGLAMAAMVALGFGISITNVGTNATLQSISADTIRGRMASLFAATRFGSEAIGGLAAGYVATVFGAPTTLLVGGAGLFLIAGLFLPRLRRLASHVGTAERGE